MQNTNVIEHRNIATLHPHPLLPELFGDVPKAEIESQAEYLEKPVLGAEPTVEVLPDGTVLAGYADVCAIRSLGRDTIQVVVRNNLNSRDKPAIVLAIIHGRRRQYRLTIIQAARCFRELRKVFRPYSNRPDFKPALRDQIAHSLKLGIKGQQLERDVRLLDLPRPIQDAIDGNHISKTQGQRILLLSSEEQFDISEDLRDRCIDRALAKVRQFLENGTAAARTSSLTSILAKLKRLEPALRKIRDRTRIPLRPKDSEIVSSITISLSSLLQRSSPLNPRRLTVSKK